MKVKYEDIICVGNALESYKDDVHFKIIEEALANEGIQALIKECKNYIIEIAERIKQYGNELNLNPKYIDDFLSKYTKKGNICYDISAIIFDLINKQKKYESILKEYDQNSIKFAYLLMALYVETYDLIDSSDALKATTKDENDLKLLSLIDKKIIERKYEIEKSIHETGITYYYKNKK